MTKNDGKDDERETETRRGTLETTRGKQRPGRHPRTGAGNRKAECGTAGELCLS